MKQKFANAFSLALIVAMLFTSVGLADQITADADVLVANNQASKDLGINFYHMKSLVLTLACKSKTSIQHRGFIQPPLLCRGGNPSTSVGGFYFVIFTLIGALKPKEVAIAKAGINLYRSNFAFQSLIQKEITL